MSEREIFAKLMQLWDNGPGWKVGRFIHDNAFRLGLRELPESYKPPAVRDEIEKAARRAGWTQE